MPESSAVRNDRSDEIDMRSAKGARLHDQLLKLMIRNKGAGHDK
jgi:hypothetical protein